jgi:exosortase
LASKSKEKSVVVTAKSAICADSAGMTALRPLMHSKEAWCAAGLVVVILLSYLGPLTGLMRRWINEPDYSHGFLVPVFSGVLLWLRRGMIQPFPLQGSWWGLLLIALAGVMRWSAFYFFFPLLEAPSLLPCLAGAALLVGGFRALRWAWPAIVYLIFMVPLPGSVAGLLSHPLQQLATISSTWLLQTIGLVAISRGNVICLTHGEIGVVEACSGLRMLMLFLALTVGASFVIERPLWEKVFVSLSALVIAVITNILRIAATAILYEYAGAELADKVFHDLAGWLMMPAAMLLLMLELYILSKLLVSQTESGPVLFRH